MQEIIKVKNLSKVFNKPIRGNGLKGMIKTLFSNKKIKFTAVNNISFTINQGEMVAYIGANGAGKSTTIKMMTGILTPTSGEVLINGMHPYDSKARKKVLQNIGVVFGQRTQLWWDLPLQETFSLLKDIYNISDKDYDERFNYLKNILELDKFIQSPVRTLSLGQRMRADLAASLLHNPSILFLDEPTIGLDILVKDHIIKAINEINKKYNTTVILTTHDMSDILNLCHRVIIIDEGKILFDGSIDEIKNKFGNIKTISLKSSNFQCEKLLEKYPDINIENKEGEINISFDGDKIEIKELMRNLLDWGSIQDLNIKENDLTNVVKTIYENKNF